MTTVDVSPNIFDRLLGTAYTPGLVTASPLPPEKFRYYACVQESDKWNCSPVLASKNILEPTAKEVRVCAYNSKIFDPAVLSAKLRGPVILTEPK